MQGDEDLLPSSCSEAAGPLKHSLSFACHHAGSTGENDVGIAVSSPCGSCWIPSFGRELLSFPAILQVPGSRVLVLPALSCVAP